ncbi:MAG: hypothetical protein GF344_09195, partial [Chitinivibrionales bacterium]|nr:hypothetical protein [Chitinivibrionales bacterium]MBD3357026.1 hypothetical protein [Chitinivibrionales bacterium]
MRKLLIPIVLLLTVSASARVNLALSPLDNASGDPLLDWVGYSFPELCFRKVYRVSDALAWDPVMLFQADSAVWHTNDDSGFTAHAARWKWDIALGGSYEARGDTLWLRIEGVRRRDERFSRKQWRIRCTKDEIDATVSRYLLELLGAVGATPSRKDSAVVMEPLPVSANVYATYARGFGYEM